MKTFVQFISELTKPVITQTDKFCHRCGTQNLNKVVDKKSEKLVCPKCNTVWKIK